MTDIKELLEYILKAITTDKDAVSVREEETEGAIIMHISVAKDDMGQVIGKEGRVIHSIRSIVKTASRGMEKRFLVEIDE